MYVKDNKKNKNYFLLHMDIDGTLSNFDLPVRRKKLHPILAFLKRMFLWLIFPPKDSVSKTPILGGLYTAEYKYWLMVRFILLIALGFFFIYLTLPNK